MLPDENMIETVNTSDAGDGQQYRWVFYENGNETTETSFGASYTYKTLGIHPVTLYVTSRFGCTDSLTREINVLGKREFEMPNAFMPDLSGPNGGYYDPEDLRSRVFHPDTKGVLAYELYIYNRWGELVFESNDVNIGWDGYIDGSLAKQDVYVWKVKATFADGVKKTYAGDVTLIISPMNTKTLGR